MSITTNHLRVREVINQVINDPDYKEISSVPLFSILQIGLIILAYALVLSGIYFASIGGSLWITYPIIIFGTFVAFTPLHDATHRAVSSHKLLNDLLGTLSGNLLLPFNSTSIYRYLHLSHHRYVGDKDWDPDEVVVGIPTKYYPFGYVVLLVHDLLMFYWLFTKGWKRTPSRIRAMSIFSIIGNTLFHGAWLMSPYAYEYLVWFLIPNRLGNAYTSYAFAHLPHPEGMHWHDFPFQSTYNLKANKIFNWSLLGQENHAIHHFLPHIPWYKYFKVWDLANGAFQKEDIPVRKVFSKPDAQFKDKVKRNGIADQKPNLQVRVTSIRDVANGIKSFTFSPLNGNELPGFAAGSHINISLPSGKVRSYSLINPSFEKNKYQIAVKLEKEGRGGSKEMHELVKEGDAFQVSHPKNNFVLYEQVNKFILISGGIGLTPLLAMAHRLTEIDKHFELHICTRTIDEVPFQYELKNWTFAPNIEFHFDKSGKSTIPLETVLAAPDDDTLVYVCGPSGFNRWIKNSAVEKGWTKSQIKEEVFSMNNSIISEPRSFELVLDKSGKTITVHKEESIIDALLLNNIQVDYTCLQGTCGTCITKVLEGEVDHRDAVLTEEQKISNDIMCLCVSRAANDTLTIEI